MSNGYSSVAEIRTANEKLGHSWFDAGTTRYHGSRVETGVIGDFYFVESSYRVLGDDSSGRVYRAVAASPAGDVQYLGGSEDRYDTKDEAIARIHSVIDHR